MKKILLLSALVSLVFASCVTKQKYTECANDLKNCT